MRRLDYSYLQAFNTLSNSRGATSAGPQPIQVSEVLALLCVQGIDEVEERVKYVALIQKMDQIYLKHAAAQVARQRKNKKP